MNRRALATLVALAIDVDSEALPTEFRIFRAGQNATSKGTFLFDDVAAKSVMADYAQHAVDLMIDLEHLSLDEGARHFSPDARGWFKLELRSGELWAVDVRWTPDGETRLREKRQRYISPAFQVEKKSGRVLRLLNVAITAMPATHAISPLVAASKGDRMEAIIAALGLAPGATEDEVIAAIKALQDAKSASADAAKASEAKAEEEKKAAAALAARASTSDGLAAEVAKLSARLAERDVRDVIAANRTKCTPALEEWALTQTPDALRAFFAKAPVVVASERKEPPKTETTELTTAELAVCKATGANPKDVLAHKAKLAARAAEVI